MKARRRWICYSFYSCSKFPISDYKRYFIRRFQYLDIQDPLKQTTDEYFVFSQLL